MRTGLRVVALGGGTGLSALLLAIKRLQLGHLAAIVTVTDDGGSTGRLRREFQIPALGDLRNCLVAVAEDDELLARLFAHRFEGEGELAGHALGNLFLAGMLQITGDLGLATRLMAEVLKVRGTIYPSTAENTHLLGYTESGEVLEGERKITSGGPPSRITLLPPAPKAVPEAVAAVAKADLVVLGPGSLYTSVIPNLLVPGIAEAVRNRRGLLVWVANLMTQAHETTGLSLEQHLQAITDHAPGVEPDLVLVNSVEPSAEAIRRYAALDQVPIGVAQEVGGLGAERLMQWPLLAETADGLVRHDRAQLLAAFTKILDALAPSTAPSDPA